MIPGVVASGRVNPNYPATVLADNPVAYWRLGDFGSTAVDSVGSSSLPYLGSSTQTTGLVGGNGARATTTGVASGVPSATLAGLAGQVSVEAWVKPTVAKSPWGVIFQDDSGGLGHLFCMCMYGGKWRLGWYNGGYKDHDLSAGFTLGATYHLVMTADGSTVSLYLDGALKAARSQMSAPMACSPGSVGIGVRAGGSFPFEGVLDEVAVYNTALSAARVAAHYQIGISA